MSLKKHNKKQIRRLKRVASSWTGFKKSGLTYTNLFLSSKTSLVCYVEVSLRDKVQWGLGLVCSDWKLTPYHPHQNSWLVSPSAKPFCHCDQSLYKFFHEEDHSTNPGRWKIRRITTESMLVKSTIHTKRFSLQFMQCNITYIRTGQQK